MGTPALRRSESLWYIGAQFIIYQPDLAHSPASMSEGLFLSYESAFRPCFIVLSVKFSRLLVGKNLFNNRLQSRSREFYTLKGIELVIQLAIVRCCCTGTAKTC